MGFRSDSGDALWIPSLQDLSSSILAQVKSSKRISQAEQWEGSTKS